MTGWRIGMAVGNAEMINALMRVKSNLDSGIPQAIQYAAIEALTGPQDCIEEHNLIYQKRRDMLVATLRQIGLEVAVPKASLYVWAKLPDGWKSADFAAKLIEEKDIVVTPGAGYGQTRRGVHTPVPYHCRRTAGEGAGAPVLVAHTDPNPLIDTRRTLPRPRHRYPQKSGLKGLSWWEWMPGTNPTCGR